MFEERRRRVIDDMTPADWTNAEWLRRFITSGSEKIQPVNVMTAARKGNL